MFKKSFFLMLAMLCLAAIHSYSAPVPNVEETDGCEQTLSSFELRWDAVSGAISYELRYVENGSGFSSSGHTTTGTTYIFQNLPGGNYSFYVRPIFGTGLGEFIGVDDIQEL